MKISSTAPITLHLHIIAHLELDDAPPHIALLPPSTRSSLTGMNRASAIELISLCFFLLVVVLMLATIGFCLFHMPTLA